MNQPRSTWASTPYIPRLQRGRNQCLRSQKRCQSRRHGGFAPFSTALPDSTSGWRIQTSMKPHKVRDSWQGGLVCRALPSHACQASNCSRRPLTTHLKLAVELAECYETHKQTASTIVRPLQSALEGIVGSSWQFSYRAHRASRSWTNTSCGVPIPDSG